MSTVVLRQLPVLVWARAQEQTDELLREMTLIAETLRGQAEASNGERHVPVRLIDLVTALTSEYAGVSTEQEQALASAAAAGQPVIEELVYEIPPQAADASRALGDMLDEADEFCRRGKHLLTLASDDEVVRFRRWYLMEFIDQIAGAAPVPWPEYDGRW